MACTKSKMRLIVSLSRSLNFTLHNVWTSTLMFDLKFLGLNINCEGMKCSCWARTKTLLILPVSLMLWIFFWEVLHFILMCWYNSSSVATLLEPPTASHWWPLGFSRMTPSTWDACLLMHLKKANKTCAQHSEYTAYSPWMDGRTLVYGLYMELLEW